MFVELCPSNHTTCSSCSSRILQNSLRATVKPVFFNSHARHKIYFATKYYHLHCYRPPTLVPINSRDLTLCGISQHSDFQAVMAWVDDWNKGILATEESVAKRYGSTAIKCVEVRGKRLLLEAFAYLEIGDIELRAARVCRNWFCASRCSELWKSKYIREYQPNSTKSDQSYRILYILQRVNSCWSCQQVLKIHEIAMKCPYFQLLICKKCVGHGNCKIVSIDFYRKAKFISESTAKMLHIPVFLHKRVKSTYAKMMVRAILPYAEKRRDQLTASLRLNYFGKVREEAIEEMENVDLERFYRQQKRKYQSEVEKQLAIFCGGNEGKETLRKSVKRCVQSLMTSSR